jgi:penicillin-binding protein 1A
MWVDFMRRALASTPPEPFSIPDGVAPIVVDRVTGAPSSPGDEGAIPDYYITRSLLPAPPLAETPPAPVPEAGAAAPSGTGGGQ